MPRGMGAIRGCELAALGSLRTLLAEFSVIAPGRAGATVPCGNATRTGAW